MIDQEDRRVGVYGVAVRGDDVLLARVAPGYPHAGSWTLPGGAAGWGETPEDALAREVHEETGLAVTSARPLLVDSVVGEGSDGRALHLVGLVFEIEVSGTLRPEPAGSTDAVAWRRLGDASVMGPLATRVLTT